MRTLTFECSSPTAYRRTWRSLFAMFGAILLLPSMAGQANANNPDKVDTDVTFNRSASNADGVGGSQMELGGAVPKARIDFPQPWLRVSGSSDTGIASSSSRTYIARASQTEQYDPVLIREVQESLKRLGFYKGSIDGTLGRGTRRAINQFQRNAGLKRTGHPTDDVVALLRMRAKTATPHGRLLAKAGQLEAYVGPGRWCRGTIGVTIRASDPMAFYEDKNELQNVVSHLHEALRNECRRFKRANIKGIAQGKQVYTAVLGKSGELKERNSRRQVSQAGGEASVCTTADPNSFDQVFACMSSARRTRGVSAGRNRFEGNIGTSDCRSIASVYIDVLGKNGGLPRSVAVDRAPNCEIFARAVIEITGKPAYWASCVGYGSKPAQAHMTKCLESFVAGYYGGGTKVTDRVRGCATAIAEYEKGLKRANKNNRLPSSYTRPSCDVALAMISKWSGTTATASSCTGYDPGKMKSHVEKCFRENVKLSTLRNCSDVRRIYEERLVEAHGRLPRNYLMMPCSAATDLLARAEAERAEIAAKQLAAAAKQRAMAAKQRAAAIERQRRIAERQTAANRAIEMARQRHERPTKTYNPEGRPPVAPGTETEPAGQPSIARSAQGASQTPAQPQQQSSGTTFSETLNEAARRNMAAVDGSETCPGNQVQSLKQAGLGDKRATVPLSNCNIHRFDRWIDMRSPLRVPRGFQRSLVREHGREVMEAGQKVISCTYGPSDSVTRKGFVGYTFWYEDAPDNIYSMLSSAPDIHPMWSLGLKSVTACPESPELARKVMLYGKIKKHREKGFYLTECHTAPDNIYVWGSTPGLETCKDVWVPYRNDWILKEASELALYRKAFVSGKAREPVESKEAEYPELALYRKAFGSGKAREPVESKEAEYTVLNYGEVPENFVPQVPELPKNRRLKITMKKLFPGSLHTIKIRPFHLGMLIKGEAGYIGRPQIQQMVREDLFAVMQSRSPVLECKYRSYRKLGPHYDYWYKNRPVTADPGRLKSRVSDHPLLFIRSPLESCPARRKEAINYK